MARNCMDDPSSLHLLLCFWLHENITEYRGDVGGSEILPYMAMAAGGQATIMHRNQGVIRHGEYVVFRNFAKMCEKCDIE